jgi:hypothetical protein
MVRFVHMRDTVGEIRAACLLVRALVAAGMHSEAQVAAAKARHRFKSLGTADIRVQALEPRLLWAEGLLLDVEGERPAARELLLRALNAFEDLGDDRSAEAVRAAHAALRNVPTQRQPPASQSGMRVSGQ